MDFDWSNQRTRHPIRPDANRISLQIDGCIVYDLLLSFEPRAFSSNLLRQTSVLHLAGLLRPNLCSSSSACGGLGYRFGS